jgi:hypothetical protein
MPQPNSGLRRPTLTAHTNYEGLKRDINNILKEKCLIYYSEGEFKSTDIPSTKTALLGLYTGENCPFLPFGVMDASGSNISWTEKEHKVDIETIGAGYEVSAQYVSVTVSEDMFALLTEMRKFKHSFLFVPEGRDDTFYAMSSVRVTTEGNLGVVEDGLGKITFKIKREVNDLTDVIKFKRLVA